MAKLTLTFKQEEDPHGEPPFLSSGKSKTAKTKPWDCLQKQ